MTEPTPLDPNWPRYSPRAFPSYRYVPGQTPHPRRHPLGHSHGQPEPTPSLFPPEHWQSSDDYRYGIDLYNFAYWWESHEVFEGFWHVTGRHTERGNFFQALIQLAAANLKHFMRHDSAARNLVQAGIIRLQNLPSAYMGIDIEHLIQGLRKHLECAHPCIPLIRLNPDSVSRI